MVPLLLLLLTAGGIRVVHRAHAPRSLLDGGSAVDSYYVAAVAQTVWPDGLGCCPQALVPSPFAGGGAPVCAGAEPLSLKPCVGTPAEIALRLKMGNVARMEAHVSAARRHAADIIVFSEGALGIANFTTAAGEPDYGGVASGALAEPIPDPQAAKKRGEIINPCLDPGAAASTPALHALSCIARKHNITLVFDMGDRVPCSEFPADPRVRCSRCPLEGFFRFNTQVALSERGALLAKYHKTHPYEPTPNATCIGDGHQQPGLSDPRFFDTSFGVRFGMMLCYDIWFYTPSLQLLLRNSSSETGAINDFVFSMHSENEEGGPIGMGTMMMEGWSRGAGANLLGANAGMGLMHTGSAIVSHGETLAHSWQPNNTHDETLLIATLPVRCRDDVEPNAVDGALEVPWGKGDVRQMLTPPVWRVVEVTPGRANYTLQAHGGFTCRFEWTATAKAAAAASSELQVLVAINGSWFGGGLPARCCEMYRLPRANLEGKPVEQWRPWWQTHRPLYRPSAATALTDLSGNITFSRLSVRGSFRRGDIVLPIFAAAEGGPGGSSLDIIDGGRGVELSKPEQVTQLQLLVNTHEPYEIFRDGNGDKRRE